MSNSSLKGRDLNIENFIAEQIAEIKASVGDDQVICALSGGVDSLVAATIVHQAIGDQLTCIFVNHGLMRYGEPESIEKLFTEKFGESFVATDASKRFLNRLENVSDPEQKRKIIGAEFIEVFQRAASNLGAKWLVQGTIYPDVIESGIGGKFVKSHHNVGGLPEKMGLKLIEPLRELYKNEVREVGKALGLPAEHVMRQPFPGPGLAIRIFDGAVTKELLETLRLVDHIVCTEIERYDQFRNTLGQYFAAMPAKLKVTGVDDEGERVNGHVVFVRTVQTKDYMKGLAGDLPYYLQQRIVKAVLSRVSNVVRVVFDGTPKPPGTIEYE